MKHYDGYSHLKKHVRALVKVGAFPLEAETVTVPYMSR